MEKIPCEVIEKAIQILTGLWEQMDEAALVSIVNHYRSYIRYLSLREIMLESGKKVQLVDEMMVLQLETKLMASISKFRMLSKT